MKRKNCHDLYNYRYSKIQLPSKHLSGCPEEKNGERVPLISCACDCYERQIYFMALADGRMDERRFLNIDDENVQHHPV